MNDGGPAFPLTDDAMREDMTTPYEPMRGMSLRDYFAGKALPGVIADPWYAEQEDVPFDAASIAADCYMIADAMLAEREKAK